MKKIFYTFAVAVLMAASCEEWEPVLTFKYAEPEEFVPAQKPAGTAMTIADFKALYPGEPLDIEEDIVLEGKVISSDKSGNIYRSMYIQDETAGIELKMGKSSLYNEYKLGQTVYVKCKGLTLGDYHGGIQLGYFDESGAYETAYLGSQALINEHILKGEMGEPVAPKVITPAEFESHYCEYVEIHDAVWKNQIFVILYDDTNTPTYISGTNMGSYNINTWSYSQTQFLKYLEGGNFKVAASRMDSFRKAASASSGCSHYFKFSGSKTELQVRTSGYSKFADVPIDADILAGKTNFLLRGILTVYDGDAQLTLLDLESGVVKK